jgi:type I restriction enzyme S subunit
MDKRFGLKTNCIADIINVLKLQPEVEEALIFGSRAMGTYKNGSDIDIALKGEKITFDTIATIRLRLDELPYLYMYDIIDYKKISNPAVTAHIDELGIIFFKKEEMPSNWKTYKLGDLYSEPSRNGLTKPSAIRGNGYKMINMKEIFAYDRMFNIPMERVPVLEKEERFFLRSGDLLFARQSLVVSGAGKCSIFLHDDEKVVFESHLIRTRFKDNLVDTKYLYYYFKSPIGRNKIECIVEFTAAAGIRGSDLARIEIELPGLDTQTKIAKILTSLDDKIELNLQMNQTLEAMAQALFKEWFVNFNFPGFDGVLENGLPKGWKRGSVLEIATLLSGGTPKTDTEDYWNGSINWISAKDITSSNNQFIIETEKTITELGIKKSTAKLLPKYTTVISARGTVGNYCILTKEMAISQSNYGLKSNSNNDFYLFLMVENMILMMKAFSYGTVFDTITTKTFQEMEVTIPEEKIIKEFEKLITPLYEKILTNQFQIQTLTQTRDTLLPKLISGKLEIKN